MITKDMAVSVLLKEAPRSAYRKRHLGWYSAGNATATTE
jgi:hypothetical protein